MKDRPVVVQELDNIDYQIIDMLQKNARISAKEISEKVFLSSTAVAARIDRLVQRGIIDGFTVKLNARALDPWDMPFARSSVWSWSRSRKTSFILI